ncbi:hypothetical protein ACFHW2_11525 [Actinomadura sp. LOL_016]|uniref:hypothetical protein n=1 Tax=unclassified Actinomadura TaxID=2626254 RepID=UPI003A80C6AE
MADLTPNTRNPQADEIRAAIRALERRRPYTAEINALADFLSGLIDRHRPSKPGPSYNARCVCGGEYPCDDVLAALALAAAIVDGDRAPQVPLNAATRANAEARARTTSHKNGDPE